MENLRKEHKRELDVSLVSSDKVQERTICFYCVRRRYWQKKKKKKKKNAQF